MGDPQIDEEMLLHMLSMPVSLDTLPQLQNAAMMVITDLWDRKVTREEFGLQGGRAVVLYVTLAKLNLLANVRGEMETEVISLERVDDAAQKLIEIAGKRMVELSRVVSLLQSCPTSRDSVN